MKTSWISTLCDIGDGLRSQPGRVGLSFLAIGIGMASLTVLLAVLGGLKQQSLRMIQELGADVVGIFPEVKSNQQRHAPLNDLHVKLLRKNLPRTLVSSIQSHKVPTIGVDQLLTVIATDHVLMDVRQWKLQEGRFFDAWDLQNHERHAVISSSLSEQWGWRPGQVITLRDTPFKIIGIIKVGGATLDAEVGDARLVLGERLVFVPNTLPPYWQRGYGPKDSSLDAIFMKGEDAPSLATGIQRARRILEQPPARVKHLSWVTPDTLIEGIKKLQRTIQLTVGSIAGLCLILGGTTLMSLMVANVRDRVSEIGLRRALGATSWDIAELFVVEAILITVAAAVTGTLGTHLVLALGRSALPVPIHMGATSLATPVGAAVVLGFLFSYWPAKVAARIMPSEALRIE